MNKLDSGTGARNEGSSLICNAVFLKIYLFMESQNCSEWGQRGRLISGPSSGSRPQMAVIARPEPD